MHTHSFADSSRKGYEICVQCGTYRSIWLLPRESIYENNYWSHEAGRSTIEEQAYNLTQPINGISKVDKVLSYIAKPGRLLEIGCAPGILLKKAKELGHDVIGIEPDRKNILGIKKVVAYEVNIVEGYFPDCLEEAFVPFDYIVAMDVLEHVKDYKAFVEAAYSIMAPGGTFIFMSPINTSTVFVRDIDYCAEEHSWIFSQQYLQEYLRSIFKDVTFDIWTQGHNIVICKK